jgi:Zn-dependent protease with chaperone function
MNFFEEQHKARGKTGLLILFFAAATAGVVALVCLGAWAAVRLTLLYNPFRAETWTAAETNRIVFWTGALASLFILAGTIYKVWQLRRSGGAGIAAMLGGDLVDPDSRKPLERRLVNVVEELAIASGLAVPPVCLLHNESGINAFAAGYGEADAVVGVTRGAVETLTRGELQGVVAHEFSHIFNGDMRLNIRLIGVIHGITGLSLTGWFLLRGVVGAGRSDDNRGGGSPHALVIGIVLVVIGSIGALFGNLIKAAVSRQREFLADAAAVQFTRDPDGIAGALLKIGGWPSGSKLVSPSAPVANHMFFGDGLFRWLGGLTATHPPLAERVRRIKPQWDGAFPDLKGHPSLFLTDEILGIAGKGRPSAPSAPEPAVGQIGRLDRAHIEYAQKLIASIPEAVSVAAHKPYSAQAVIFGLLMDSNAEVRQRQLEIVKTKGEEGLALQTEQLLPELAKVRPNARLPLVDLTLPALRKQIVSPAGLGAFRDILEALIRADDKVALFEWTLHRIVLGHLRRHLDPGRGIGVKFNGLDQVAGQCAALLSCLAHQGSLNRPEVELAFKKGAAELDMDVTGLELQSREEASWQKLGVALKDLGRTAPLLKEKIVNACAAVISADRTVTVTEGELMRAICETLGCPMPPLLPGQRLI